ncbi:MAG: molybdenum cofactor biosynthesis protein MoaE [Anaerolineae bacterium]|nr:molybdenum cofactor biosynthesis protein MoaE [Anaerolineae bacterium]
MTTRVTDAPLELAPLLAETEDDACGALVIFSGVVRNTNDGRPVSGMTYDAHVALAERVLAEIEAEALARFGVRHCRIVHRVGTLALGEVSVYVVVRAAHRAEAFEAARYAIDEVKARAPIWKEEHYTDGASRYLDGTPLRIPSPEADAR